MVRVLNGACKMRKLTPSELLLWQQTKNIVSKLYPNTNITALDFILSGRIDELIQLTESHNSENVKWL